MAPKAPAPAKRPKVLINDLTIAQIEEIELEVGIPVNRWGADAPKGTLFPLILSVIHDEDPKKYKAMRYHELLALVSLDDDGSDEEGGANP